MSSSAAGLLRKNESATTMVSHFVNLMPIISLSYTFIIVFPCIWGAFTHRETASSFFSFYFCQQTRFFALLGNPNTKNKAMANS